MSDFYSDDPIVDDELKSVQKTPGFKRIIGFGAIALLALGQTFAANININSGAPVEFGQGVRLTAACTGNSVLTLRPIATFVNQSQAGEYYLKEIRVSGVPAGCTGLDFTIKLYGETGSALAAFGGGQTDAVIYFDGSTYVKGPGTGYTVTGTGTEFTLTYSEPLARAAQVNKFTIESGGHVAVTCLNGGTCSLGDTGPGGGTIFYASAGTFTMYDSPCGSSCKYLEYAPRNWGNGIPVASGESSGTSSSWPALKWCAGTGATSAITSIVSRDETAMMMSTFGLGYRSSATIASNCTSGAGKTAFDLTYGGKTDWFLPSFSEMHQLCKYVRGSAGQGTITTICSGGTLDPLFPTTHYWTSTESDETPGQAAWLFFLGTPDPDDDLKGYAGITVPIRAFG